MTSEEIREAVYGYNCIIKKSLGNKYILIRIIEKEFFEEPKKEIVEYVLCGNSHILKAPIESFDEFEPTKDCIKQFYANGEVITSTKFK